MSRKTKSDLNRSQDSGRVVKASRDAVAESRRSRERQRMVAKEARQTITRVRSTLRTRTA